MTNTKATRTQVSKANAGIKAILAAVGMSAWTGRKVTIVEVGSDWTYTQYVDGMELMFVVCLDDMSAGRAPAPVYSHGQGYVTHAAHEGTALVIHHRKYGCNDIEIVIPAGEDYHGAIDAMALEVTVDAMLARGKGGTTAAQVAGLIAVTSAHAGMRGIAGALAEARTKALRKGQNAAQLEAA